MITKINQDGCSQEVNLLISINFQHYSITIILNKHKKN